MRLLLDTNCNYQLVGDATKQDAFGICRSKSKIARVIFPIILWKKSQRTKILEIRPETKYSIFATTTTSRFCILTRENSKKHQCIDI